MFSRERRLRAKEVVEVLEHGRSRRGGSVSLKILDTKTPFRAAVVVSKRLARTAFKRNALRRAAFEALGRASLPPTGHAILFIQSIPPRDMVATFLGELTKIFHV